MPWSLSFLFLTHDHTRMKIKKKKTNMHPFNILAVFIGFQANFNQLCFSCQLPKLKKNMALWNFNIGSMGNCKSWTSGKWPIRERSGWKFQPLGRKVYLDSVAFQSELFQMVSYGTLCIFEMLRVWKRCFHIFNIISSNLNGIIILWWSLGNTRYYFWVICRGSYNTCRIVKLLFVFFSNRNAFQFCKIDRI